MIILKREKDKLRFTDLQISCFSVIESRVEEFMIMITGYDNTIPFEGQVDNIITSFNEFMTKKKNAICVFRRFFLSDPANQYNYLISKINKEGEGAVSVIGQPPLNGSKVVLWAYVQTGVEVAIDDRRLFGVRNGVHTHLWTGNTFTHADSPEKEMRILFDDYRKILSQHKCSLDPNCIRTWLFVQNIDVNYKDVVKARNDVFAEVGLTSDNHFISSTGIQGCNACPDVTVQMDAYSVTNIDKDQVRYLYAPKFLNRTSEYGVSFERGTSITYDDRQHVFISGTASIDNKGNIVYKGDVEAQAERVVLNVQALLHEAGCSLTDITQMIVYLRDMNDYETVSMIYNERLGNIPKVFLLAPVCRPGWLVEMECIAMKSKL